MPCTTLKYSAKRFWNQFKTTKKSQDRVLIKLSEKKSFKRPRRCFMIFSAGKMKGDARNEPQSQWQLHIGSRDIARREFFWAKAVNFQRETLFQVKKQFIRWCNWGGKWKKTTVTLECHNMRGILELDKLEILVALKEATEPVWGIRWSMEEREILAF